ncbi:MAG: SDR family NAD(P)-dependent oxidoreductase [Lautropia sp.]
MSTELAGRVAVVTGASRGLGLTMASALVDAGAQVVMTARTGSLPLLERRCAEIGIGKPGTTCLALAADITDPAACQRVVADTLAAFGRLDILFNNAGLGMNLLGSHVRRTIPFHQVPVAIWKQITDTNINGTFLMSRAAIDPMLRQRWGRIVNLSTSLSTMPRPGFSPYGPSKAAIDVMTAIWAQELDGTGITVNSLLPGGPCDTDMIPSEDFPEREQLIPPSVMIGPALWLASARSDGVTGRRVTAKLWPAGSPDPAGAALAPAVIRS